MVVRRVMLGVLVTLLAAPMQIRWGADAQEGAPETATERDPPSSPSPSEEAATIEAGRGPDAEPAPGKQVRDDHARSLMLQMARQSNGYVHVAGRVVTTSGEPVEQVSLRVQRTQSKGLFETSEDESQSTVDGSFEVEAEDASSLYLTFEKAGYVAERRSFLIARDAEIEALGEEQAPRVVRDDIRIVLFTRVEAAAMRNFMEPIIFHANGSGTAIDIDRSPQRGRSVVSVESIDELRIDNGFHVSAPVAAEAITTERVRLPGKDLFVIYPVAITLHATAPDGGFLLIEDFEGEDRYRELIEAPNEGYQREVRLTAEQLLRHPYFYFRSNGKYGKGGVGWIKVGRDNEDVTVNLVVRVQPDGSRRLLSRD